MNNECYHCNKINECNRAKILLSPKCHMYKRKYMREYMRKQRRPYKLLRINSDLRRMGFILNTRVHEAVWKHENYNYKVVDL